MPEPSWVRVRKPGVGTWSQREDVPLLEGAIVLEGEPGLDPAGRARPDVPEEPDAALEDAPSAPQAGESGETDTESSTETPDGATEATEAAASTWTRRR